MTHWYPTIERPFSEKACIEEEAQKYITYIKTIDTFYPHDITEQIAKKMAAKETVTYELDVKAGEALDAQDIANTIMERVEKRAQQDKENYFEVNYTSNGKSLPVYAGSDPAVIEGLTCNENTAYLRECTPVQTITIIARGGLITTVDVQ